MANNSPTGAQLGNTQLPNRLITTFDTRRYVPKRQDPTPADSNYQMVNYLGNKACASGWMPQEALDMPREGLGVLLRQSRGQYMCRPVDIEPSLLLAVQRLNVAVAMTIRPDMLESIFNTLEPFQTELRLKDGSQLQIIQSLTSITASTVKKFQYACLLRQERTVLVWHDEVNQILIHAGRVEERLLSFVRSSTLPRVNMQC